MVFSVEQLQEIHAVRLCERCDLLGVEFLIVCGKYSISILLPCNQSELFHNRVSRLLICHSGKLVHRHIQCRDALRDIEATVICKSLKPPGMLSRQSPRRGYFHIIIAIVFLPLFTQVQW